MPDPPAQTFRSFSFRRQRTRSAPIAVERDAIEFRAVAGEKRELISARRAPVTERRPHRADARIADHVDAPPRRRARRRQNRTRV